MEHFTNPIADFFKSTNKAVIYIEFSIFGSLLVFVAVFLYFFYFKSKKIEHRESFIFLCKVKLGRISTTKVKKI